MRRLFYWRNSSLNHGVIHSQCYQTPLGLLERHTKSCICGYCVWQLRPWHGPVLYTAPGRKAWNSWWVIGLRLGKYKYYLRYHSVFYRRWAK